MKARRITAVTATASPDSGRPQMIDQQSLPILKSEALQAQSANIQSVSGATQISEAFVSSLQSALSAAGL